MSRPKVVLLGMLTKIPVGGVMWLVRQYAVGFRRLVEVFGDGDEAKAADAGQAEPQQAAAEDTGGDDFSFEEDI